MAKRFYDALKEVLETTEWSIPKLSAASGVSKDQITKFMQRGARDPNAGTNVDDAVKIANALGVTVDEMLDDQTARLRSQAVDLWGRLSQGERDILLAAARGQSGGQDRIPEE